MTWREGTEQRRMLSTDENVRGAQCPSGCCDSWGVGCSPMQVRRPHAAPQDEVVSGLSRGTDSNGSVLLEWRVGSSATSGLGEKPQGPEQNCRSVSMRTSSEDVNPASPGDAEEGRLCGRGTGARPAGESRFLTPQLSCGPRCQRLQPTAQLCEFWGSLGWAGRSETSSPA